MGNEIIERKSKIVKLLENQDIKGRLLSFLEGDEKKLERFKGALLNIALDGSLQKASPQSIVKSALAIAELNLPLTKNLGLAYIVAYKKEAQPQIGYKGWLVLLRRAGILAKPRVVYDVDEFGIEYEGFEDKYYLKPNIEEREEGNPKWIMEHFKGVWISVKFLDSGEVQDWFVDVKKIRQLANLSPALRAKKGFSPYETGFMIEMYIAKAIGWVARRLGIDSEIMDKLFEIENITSELPKETVVDEKEEDVFEIEAVEIKEEEKNEEVENEKVSE